MTIPLRDRSDVMNRKATGSIAEKNGILYTIINTYADGKRRQKWETTNLPVKSNKTKAREILELRLKEYDKKANEARAVAKMLKTGEISPQMPFYLFVPVWLESAKSRIDIVTYDGYSGYVKNHVVPYFKKEGSTIEGMSRKKIQAFIDYLALKGNIKTGGPLAAKSIKRVKNIVKQTLDKAVKDELILVNPCNLIDMPPIEKKEPNFLSAAEANKFLSCIKDEPIYPIIKMTVSYGLRRSEVMGLKWENIDLENNLIFIRHTVVRVNGLIAKDKTKTSSSRRTLAISDEIKQLLLKLKEEEEKNRKLCGRDYIENDYIFKWPDGHSIAIDYVTRKFSKLLKQHGFKHIRFHDLRHSCASILLSAGYELKDVQDLLGHSEISITADLYGHIDTKRKQKIADTMSELLNC